VVRSPIPQLSSNACRAYVAASATRSSSRQQSATLARYCGSPPRPAADLAHQGERREIELERSFNVAFAELELAERSEEVGFLIPVAAGASAPQALLDDLARTSEIAPTEGDVAEPVSEAKDPVGCANSVRHVFGMSRWIGAKARVGARSVVLLTRDDGAISERAATSAIAHTSDRLPLPTHLSYARTGFTRAREYQRSSRHANQLSRVGRVLLRSR
jgi:hypothetical protein